MPSSDECSGTAVASQLLPEPFLARGRTSSVPRKKGGQTAGLAATNKSGNVEADMSDCELTLTANHGRPGDGYLTVRIDDCPDGSCEVSVSVKAVEEFKEMSVSFDRVAFQTFLAAVDDALGFAP